MGISDTGLFKYWGYDREFVYRACIESERALGILSARIGALPKVNGRVHPSILAWDYDVYTDPRSARVDPATAGRNEEGKAIDYHNNDRIYVTYADTVSSTQDEDVLMMASKFIHFSAYALP